MKILGVIPARGGSKGIPRKNILTLADKPLIYYSIEAGIKSELISDLIVSTDDEEIKAVSETYGAAVPFLRPPELSHDAALAIPTIQHATGCFEQITGMKFDYVIMLQPTAPLRTSSDIDTALQLLIEKGADGIISVVNVGNNHPAKMKVIREGILYDYIDTGTENPPRQHLPSVYIVNGAIYATKRDVLMNSNTFKGIYCLPYVMPTNRSVNIDEPVDFIIAEYYLSKSSV